MSVLLLVNFYFGSKFPCDSFRFCYVLIFNSHKSKFPEATRSFAVKLNLVYFISICLIIYSIVTHSICLDEANFVNSIGYCTD